MSIDAYGRAALAVTIYLVRVHQDEATGEAAEDVEPVDVYADDAGDLYALDRERRRVELTAKEKDRARQVYDAARRLEAKARREY